MTHPCISAILPFFLPSLLNLVTCFAYEEMVFFLCTLHVSHLGMIVSTCLHSKFTLTCTYCLPLLVLCVCTSAFPIQIVALNMIEF